jgi:LPS-assembly protein
MTFAVTAERTLTRDSSGDSGTEVMMRLGLKNLGEFQTSGINLGSSGSGDDEEADTTNP